MQNEKSKKIFSSKSTRSVIIIAAVLLIGLAVYLNYRWFYDPIDSLGYGDNNMDDNLGGSQETGGELEENADENNYFTSTALTRKQSRDEAIDVLKLVAESVHPTKYGEELVKKMEKSGAKAYLVNTGWNGTGKRISIKDTRGIIDAILDGSILKAETKTIPYFNLEVPTALPGVDSGILDPRDTYADAAQWEEKAKDLASRFIKNFVKYTGNDAGKALVEAGPQL